MRMCWIILLALDKYMDIKLEYKAVDAIVKEDIRQKIIYTQYPDKYLSYVNSFASKCLK